MTSDPNPMKWELMQDAAFHRNPKLFQALAANIHWDTIEEIALRRGMTYALTSGSTHDIRRMKRILHSRFPIKTEYPPVGGK